MSLNKNKELSIIAKNLSRELRKKSTTSENKLWKSLRNKYFNNIKFRRQHPIFFDYEGKETFYIADFYCHEKNLIIEIDGGYHNSSDQKQRDKKRTHIINMLGLKVIRFKNYEVENNLDDILKKLECII